MLAGCGKKTASLSCPKNGCERFSPSADIDFSADVGMGLTFGELDGAAIEEFRERWIAKARKAEDGRWGSL